MMEVVSNQNDYESLRNARIAENKAKLAALGILHYPAHLLTIEFRFDKPKHITKRPRKPRLLVSTAIRRSDRRTDSDDTSAPKLEINYYETPERAARKRLPLFEHHIGKIRGVVYDSVVGICCHSCRQKTLCREENCKRCENRDANLPCIGKTECSSCHSSQGVFCRGCLKVRHGEELEQVRANKEWMCPHCIKEKGIKKDWLCSSSLCLKRRKIAPIGFDYRRAPHKQQYESLAHYLVDRLNGRVLELC